MWRLAIWNVHTTQNGVQNDLNMAANFQIWHMITPKCANESIQVKCICLSVSAADVLIARNALHSTWPVTTRINESSPNPTCIYRYCHWLWFKEGKVKEVDLYIAFIVVPHTQGTQIRITQCYLQITPYLPLPRKHSPDGASPDWGCGHLIAAYYSFIYSERTRGWVGLVGWPTADSLPT